MFVRSFLPKPPCAVCGGPTLPGEVGQLLVGEVTMADGSTPVRAGWLHLTCLRLAGMLRRRAPSGG